MNPIRPYDPDSTPLDGTMILEASAGTGKTYALERMVARLVGEGDRPLEIGEILVVTFTNRAAREMRERIRSILVARREESKRSTDERMRYARALAGFDMAPIHTIHGFCQMVLATWPFESSAPFRQELEPGGDLERNEARAWLASLKDPDVDGVLLQSAYGQAGSVDALVEQIARELTDESIPPGCRSLPDESEAVAFADYAESSRASGSPLSIAVSALADRPWSDEAMNGLLKSAAANSRSKAAKSLQLIRDHLTACRDARGVVAVSAAFLGDPAGIGVKKHFRSLLRAAVLLQRGEAERPELVEDGSESEKLAEALQAFFGEMEPYISLTEADKGDVESLVELYMWRSFMVFACREVESRVENRKEAEGRWGYADLIRRVAAAVEHPDSPLRVLLRNRFQAALIDEFQDTDPRQWRLFRSLFGEAPHLLALIGDPKQSIYGFRGTGLQAYESARETVEAGNLFRLDTNYRSVPRLVASVNRLFAPVFQSGCLGNPPVGFVPVASGKDSDVVLDGAGDSAPLVLLDVPTPPKGEGDLLGAAAGAIVAEIRRLLDGGDGARWRDVRGVSGRTRPVAASDIAILVRSEAQEDEALARLTRAGIPGIRIRSRSVFDRPACGHLREILAALSRPRDVGRWKAVLLGALFRVPPELLRLLEAEGKLDGFVEQGLVWRDMFLAGRSSAALDAFFDYAVVLADWSVGAGYSELGSRFRRSWPTRVLAETDGERQWQDWYQLCDLMQNRQAEGLREPHRLIAWLDDAASGGSPEGRDDAVRLETESPAVRVLTMHASKGLEFPLVFLLGGFGGKRSRRKGEPYRFDDHGTLTVDRIGRDANRNAHLAYGWEEDKRLLYVAFTRAVHGLWVARPADGEARLIDSLLAEALGMNSTDGLPAHLALDRESGEELRNATSAALAEWAADPEPLLSIRPGNEPERPPLTMPAPVAFGLAPLPVQWTGLRDQATSSYTGLVRAAVGNAGAASGEGEHFADRDVDRALEPPVPIKTPGYGANAGEPLPLASDRGALFGTLVHALFEECDFSRAGEDDPAAWFSDEGVENLFAAVSGRHYPPDWYRSRGAELKSLVRRVLRAPVPGLGRLCDIPDADRRAEVEFVLSLPEDSRPVSGDLETHLPPGFLKGFIDLLAHRDGRWWVVDWKTNVPDGAVSALDYSEDVVEDVMRRHHYALQYELYLLALCRTLAANRGTPVDWDAEIGGAAYLFVRGMRESDGRGVCVGKPPASRMKELASAAGLPEVLS